MERRFEPPEEWREPFEALERFEVLECFETFDDFEVFEPFEPFEVLEPFLEILEVFGPRLPDTADTAEEAFLERVLFEV